MSNSQHLCAYLSHDNHNGRAVHHGIGYASNGVGGTRTACYKTYSHTAAHTGIAFGSVGGGLFVTHEDMVQAVAIVVKGIVNRHDGTAGIAEKCFHTFGHKRTHEYFCAGYFFRI